MDAMRVEKFKKNATTVLHNNKRINVNFFLSHYSVSHKGSETILDVLNSQKSFVSLENAPSKEMAFVGKSQLVYVEVQEKIDKSTANFPSCHMVVPMYNDETIEGKVYIDMPPSHSRLSDVLNNTDQFICIYREHDVVVINKSYVISAMEI